MNRSTKLGLICCREDDLQGALLTFVENRAGLMMLGEGAVTEGDLDRAAALQFEAVAKRCSGLQGLCTEAGAGVVHLHDAQWCGAVIGDGGFDVLGVAACECERESGEERETECALSRLGHVGRVAAMRLMYRNGVLLRVLTAGFSTSLRFGRNDGFVEGLTLSVRVLVR